MVEYVISRFIAAPTEACFDVAADFPNAAATVEDIKKIEMLTEGPVGVGTRFRETRVMFKREATEEMEVEAFERPQRYVLGADSCGSRFRSELRFESQGAGTNAIMTFQATPRTLGAKIMGFVMRPMMKKMMLKCIAKDLDDVAQAAESRRGASKS